MPVQVTGTAFITGGASGIGKATAISLAINGINALVLFDLHAPTLDSTATELTTRFPHVTTERIIGDVTREEDVNRSVDHAVNQFGGIDIAVHAAGISGLPGPMHALALRDWERVIAVNQTGVWLCQRAVVRAMLKQVNRGPRLGKGVIVSVASMFGVSAPPGELGIDPYTASKHAVVAVTKHNAKAYAKEGIRINAICPGYVDTPLTHLALEAGVLTSEIENTPMGRVASAEEIADSVLYLASPMSSFACGTALVVDGGYTA